MRPLDFPPDDLDRIDHDRFGHPCPHVQRRMELLGLAAHGVSRADLARLTGFSWATIQRRLDDYRDGGLAAVRPREPAEQAEDTGHLEPDWDAGDSARIHRQWSKFDRVRLRSRQKAWMDWPDRFQSSIRSRQARTRSGSRRRMKGSPR